MVFRNFKVNNIEDHEKSQCHIQVNKNFKNRFKLQSEKIAIMQEPSAIDEKVLKIFQNGYWLSVNNIPLRKTNELHEHIEELAGEDIISDHYRSH